MVVENFIKICSVIFEITDMKEAKVREGKCFSVVNITYCFNFVLGNSKKDSIFSIRKFLCFYM